jgi:putative addiction module component (TIGR02574 family)
MSVTEVLEKARALAPEQRRELAEILLTELDEGDELSPELRAELDRRAEEALAHPETCRPWEEVRADLHARLKSAG